MNPAAAAWLRAQIRSHNRHALWLAILSMASAILAWNLACFFLVLILLGVDTAIHGDMGPQMSPWIRESALALAVVLFVWGIVDHAFRRFDGVPDRAIIGWHLFADFLLLPVRLTFAIWGNICAIRRLDEGELSRAWELLVLIQHEGRGRLSALTLIEPAPRRLFRLLTTLQMIDLIDLHRGEGDWFYTVRSTHGEELGKLLASPQ